MMTQILAMYFFSDFRMMKIRMNLNKTRKANRLGVNIPKSMNLMGKHKFKMVKQRKN